MSLHKVNQPWAILLFVLLAGVSWPASVAAHGFGDMRAVGTMAGLLGVGVVVLLLFTLYLLISGARTLRRWPNVLLLILLSVLSQAAAQALNNFIWDQLYQGPYFTPLALSGGVLIPLCYLLGAPLFAPRAPPRRVWRVNALLGGALALLLLGWFLAETAL